MSEITEKLLREMAPKYWGYTYEGVEVRDALLAGAEAMRERDRLAKLVYVPGMRKCAKCGCVLITTNLHVDTGGFSANNEPQACPNGCGPMWPVTERDAGNEMVDRMETVARERGELRETVKALRKALPVLYTMCMVAKLPADAEKAREMMKWADEALGVEYPADAALSALREEASRQQPKEAARE